MKPIAFLTDIHLDEQFPIDNNVYARRNWERVLADVSARKIDEIIFGGDIGEVTSHEWFFETLKPFSVKLILGNHDKFDDVRQYYEAGVNSDELYYTFEDSNYKQIFLDTSSDEVSNTQLEWLKQELTTTRQLILFSHHPVIEIRTAPDRLYPLKNREQMKAILVENGANVTIFCGHYHMNDERTFKNIKQITTQAISFQLDKTANEMKVDNTCFGYRIIHFENDRIETQIITFNHEDF